MTEKSLNLLRLSTREFGAETCPAHQRRRPESQLPKSGEPMLIGELHTAVKKRFINGETPPELVERMRRVRSLGPIERRWLCSAVARFPDPFIDGYRLTGFEQVAHVPLERRELYGWGLWAYTENYDAVRVYLPRYRAGGAPYPRERVLATAYLGAQGFPGTPPPYGTWYERPHQPRDIPRMPAQVEVAEYYADTGRLEILYRGSAEQTEREYLAHGARMSRLLRIEPLIRRPGGDCDRCVLIGDCSAVPKVPGLLGIKGNGKGRRTWSATNGRNFGACPRRDHLYRRNLPGMAPGTRELIGRAVDTVLDGLHRSSRACTAADLPASRAEWFRAGYELEPDASDVATAMLRQHLPRCPWLAGPSVRAARMDRTVTVYDPVADVVVHAQADLLYEEDGAWVWRELKTRERVWNGDPLQSHDALQLSLAVLLAGAGIDGRRVRRIELEQITVDERDLHPIPVDDADVLSRAREVVHAAVQDWYHDPTDAPTPGRACAFCQYRVICPDAAEGGT
ncbi:PD-(D/E)XK nuclease family protein [Phytomonospora endophytica]|uniref:PD-(D/E)XK endonuclease-like domain-containing protein n=1 Tax=Phytomonospora endophytica TaxID=714109 RepID=A0A841FLW5_9ACTN|nr:PD-(D/E)XK nuclease family protein [Phytomonospora endophytica]MBB6032940.1 hypothetical protein [Phytomonospora endophytica]GIG65166.1 hypothetical protein Pen01_14610 [Phytomonospora endophytica]